LSPPTQQKPCAGPKTGYSTYSTSRTRWRRWFLHRGCRSMAFVLAAARGGSGWGHVLSEASFALIILIGWLPRSEVPPGKQRERGYYVCLFSTDNMVLQVWLNLNTSLLLSLCYSPPNNSFSFRSSVGPWDWEAQW
jgi:hypothetical protein